MKLGYGLVTCQRYPGDPRTPRDLYREALQIARRCDDVGLDSIWTSEHHFWDDDYMPSLLVVSSAIAATTKRITVGTGVLLAPLYDPIRLAEDSATVSLIADGRLILGLGIGWRQEEFERLRIPLERPGQRLSETVKILRAAWGSEPVEFQGKIFQYETTNVTPKPTKPIPIWIGGFVDDALRRAGRIGDGYFGSSPRLDDLARRVALVKEAGPRPEFAYAIHEPVFEGHDPEKFLKYFHNSRWKYDDMRNEFGRSSKGPLPQPPLIDAARRQSLLEMVIHGSAEQVAARIREFAQVAGEDLHFVCRSYYPGVPLTDALKTVDFLAEVRALLSA